MDQSSPNPLPKKEGKGKLQSYLSCTREKGGAQRSFDLRKEGGRND